MSRSTSSGHPYNCVSPQLASSLLQPEVVQAPAVFPGLLTSGLFRNLPSDKIQAVLLTAQSRTYCAGEFLCRQGEPASYLYLLVSGLVKTTGPAPSGGTAMLDWMRRGDVMGVGAILSPPAPYLWSAEALEDTQALRWSHETLLSICSKWPDLYRNALGIALQWALALQTRFQALSAASVEQRIAGVTVWAAKCGDKDERELRTSDDNIAQMAGTNRFTVNKVFSRWRRLGYIERDRMRLSILNRDMLLRLSIGGV